MKKARFGIRVMKIVSYHTVQYDVEKNTVRDVNGNDTEQSHFVVLPIRMLYYHTLYTIIVFTRFGVGERGESLRIFLLILLAF